MGKAFFDCIKRNRFRFITSDYGVFFVVPKVDMNDFRMICATFGDRTDKKRIKSIITSASKTVQNLQAGHIGDGHS
jgi:hypothetical protein